MKLFNKNKEEKQEISYEQLIAGALLKFDEIDNVDFSLLVEDFKSKTNTEIRGVWYNLKTIGNYLKCKTNGTILLREEFNLDSFLEKEYCTLGETLKFVSGDIVNEYFKNFDLEQFKTRKKQLLDNNKEQVLNIANVLLISDVEEDYKALKEYGFKNIDYFKSIIRADAWFEKYPEQLEKYHIVIKGNQNVQRCCMDGDVPLDRKISELRNNTRNIIETPLNICGTKANREYVLWLDDRYNYKGWDTNEPSYSSLFDRLVENTLINHTLENFTNKVNNIIEYKDIDNPTRLPLPKKKSDLKILYLDSVMVFQYAEEIAKNLGLDITFKEDNNCGLGRYVKSHLGDYDIIIVSNTYSSNILCMNNESTEQCRDTGRELTVLATYDDESIWTFDEDHISDTQGIASKLTLNYSYGGNLALDKDIKTKEFSVLRQQVELEAPSEQGKKYRQSRYSDMQAIIEAAVNIYNEALIRNEKEPIQDMDFKSAETFEQEYQVEYNKEEERKKQALAPIHAFNEIMYSVIYYLDYKKDGLITQNPQGLRITKEQNGEIKVENIYEGRPLCAIIFSEQNRENIRTFKIQLASNKGNLLPPETIGVYTRKYEGQAGVPNRPNEKQANALHALQKKVNFCLSPLNDEARKKYWELKDKQDVLKRKKKK